MEEDNIAVSLCILIVIASAILRIRIDRRPHGYGHDLGCADAPDIALIIHCLQRTQNCLQKTQQGTDIPISGFSFADLGIFYTF